MNCNLSLLKLLLPFTLATGVLMPLNIAEAAGYSSKESYTTTEIQEESHQADADKKPVKITKILLSQKAQKIEFFGLLGIIGASLFIPELLGKSSKKSRRNGKSVDATKPVNLDQAAINENEPDISYLEEILKDTKKIDFVSNNLVKIEDHKKNGLNTDNHHNKKIS